MDDGKSRMIVINGRQYESGNLPDELTFQLRKQVVVGSDVIDSFELSEPTAGDYEQFIKASASSNSAGAVIKLIALVAAKKNPLVSEAIVKRIGMRDMNEITDYLLDFIQPGQITRTF